MEGMWFKAARRERLAKDALARLCSDAFTDIRGSAYLDRVLSLSEIEPPSDLEVREYIRVLADTCHNFPAAFGSGNRYRYPATEAFHYEWQVAGEFERDWIAKTLARRNIDLAPLIEGVEEIPLEES